MAKMVLDIAEIRTARRFLTPKSSRTFRRLCQGQRVEMNNLSFLEIMSFLPRDRKARYGFGRARNSQ